MVGFFTTTRKDAQVGVDFLPDGVAVAQVSLKPKSHGAVVRAEFLPANGQQEQVEALTSWVRGHHLQKAPCVCLISPDDCDVYQVERPQVEAAELTQALTWKIKDLINYDVEAAVVESYPMPASRSSNQPQVGVVAAHETVIENYVESIRSTNLKLSALDIHDLVRPNLDVVQQSAGTSLALLSLSAGTGSLSVFHDTDLYVARDFAIGLDKLEQVDADDETVLDALLVEIQRSLDYFENHYDVGAVNDLRIFPRVRATEKLAMYLNNLTSYDIDFIEVSLGEISLDPSCFHAYCAALRGAAA